MHQKLTNLAEIISGYTFRGSIEPCPNGEVYVVQPGNIRIGENINAISHLERISNFLSGHRGYLLGNDVLLVVKSMKGSSFRSCVFTYDNYSDHVLVSSSIMVLRVKLGSILPQYLSLFLNSNFGQRLLAKIAVGEYVSSVPKGSLEDLEIPLPSMAKQIALVNLSDNLSKQRQLLQKEIIIKESILNASFQQIG